jgi:hypothetical protein
MSIDNYRDHCFIEACEVVRNVELVHQEGDVRGHYRIEILKEATQAVHDKMRYVARYSVQKEPGGPWTPIEAPVVRRQTDEEALDQALASLNLAVSTPA